MNASDIPVDLLNVPFTDWKLSLSTVLIAVMLLGRGFKALKSGGGLYGVWRGILYGENTPTPPKITVSFPENHEN